MHSGKKRVAEILDRVDVQYWLEGKNVSNNSVNVQCPFCGDHSNHCGIFVDSLIYHCWRCGVSGPLGQLLRHITNWPQEEIEELISKPVVSHKIKAIDQIRQLIAGEQEERVKPNSVGEILLPPYFELLDYDIDFPLLNNFLERRGIAFDTALMNGCGICRVGPFMNRMIVPVLFEGKLVGYQAVDLAGTAELKYLSSDDVKEYLYGYDDINSTLVLVEGIFDEWRFGEGSCASFGTTLTEAQVDLVLKKKPKSLIFCWDGDAWFIAREKAKVFRAFIDDVRIVQLPKTEDPDSFGKKYGKETLLKRIDVERIDVG